MQKDSNVASLIQNENRCWLEDWTSSLRTDSSSKVGRRFAGHGSLGNKNKGRLVTQDKIAIWKPNEPLKCSFFVWNEILMILDKKMIVDWDRTIKEMAKLNVNNSIWSITRRLVFGVVVYFIWQERNIRLFKHVKRDEETLVQVIKDTVKLRMMSLIVKESQAIRRMKEIWNVKLKRVKQK
ncbi:hypothetical protein Tco_1460307, partial [Tanacetum coccineum]